MKPHAFAAYEVPPIFPWGEPQALSDTGVISIASLKTDWTTTGAATATLADGVCDGHLKIIQMVADQGNAVLTPNSLCTKATVVTPR